MTMGEKSGAWILPAASVAVFAALIAAFWGTVVRLILQPLAWLLWAGWRVLASVDPEIWWVIVALACAVPVIRLFDAQLRSQDESHSGDAVQPGPGGRLEHWIDRAAGMRRGDGGRELLRADLASLAASVAQTTRTPLAPEWSHEPSPAKQASPRITAADRAESALLQWLPGFRRRADEQAIARLLDWMEAALEIRDDEPSG
jgi:hypothetical protein